MEITEERIDKLISERHEIWQAFNYNHLDHVDISLKKFVAICDFLLLDDPVEVMYFIQGGDEGWDDIEAHQEWISSASAKDIADWTMN